MKVTLKLFASLGDYLPADAKQNAVELNVNDQASTTDLLHRCGLPEQSVHLVLLNGVYVAPGRRSTTVLQPGDVVAVWPPVAGG